MSSCSPKSSPIFSRRNNKRHSCSPLLSPKRDTHVAQNKGEQYSTCVFIGGDQCIQQYDVEVAIPNRMYWAGSVEGYKRKILESDGFLLVYSKESRQSYMKLIELISDIQKLRKNRTPPMVIMGNKTDLNQNTLQAKESERIVFGSVPHFNVSALDNTGIQESFKALVRMIDEEPFTC